MNKNYKNFIFLGLTILTICLLNVAFVIIVDKGQDSERVKGVEVVAAAVELPDTERVEAGVNGVRVERGLPALSPSPALDTAAQTRAQYLCDRNQWSHDASWDVLAPYYAYQYAGENLYYNAVVGGIEQDAVTKWVASPGHYANIINPNYTEIGTGMAKCQGYQALDEGIIIVNYFGAPQ